VHDDTNATIKKSFRLPLIALGVLILCACSFTALALTLPSTWAASPVGVAQAKTSIASSKVQVTKLKKAYSYTGRAVKPKPTLTYKNRKLKRNRDYTLSYKRNVKVGTATLIIKGMRSFKKTRKVTFKIAYSLAKHGKVTLPYRAYYYTGEAIEPSVKVKYRNKKLSSKHYRISYKNNVDKGTATVTVKGRRGYKGTLTKTFIISTNLRANVKTSLSRKTFAYTGTARKPVPTLTYGSKKLSTKTDYTYSYSNNIKVGTATISFKGENGYHFSFKKHFKITKSGGKIVDVSEWQGSVKWKKVAPEIDVAILRSYVMYSSHTKAGDRTSKDSTKHRIDKRYLSFAKKCKKLGIPFGSYGFVVFHSKADAVKQATEFFNCAVYGNVKGTGSVKYYPNFLAFDLEASSMDRHKSKIAAWTRAAAIKVQSLAKKAGFKNGIKLGIYISNDHWKTYGFTKKAGKKTFKKYLDFAWFAIYGKNNGKIPKKKKNRPAYPYDMWQYTSVGKVSGISGDVDLSVVHASGPKGHNMSWYMKP
jgi:GH25 family lysozyme M1 (1,4-beta-N-acetylmuramidase)